MIASFYYILTYGCGAIASSLHKYMLKLTLEVNVTHKREQSNQKETEACSQATTHDTTWRIAQTNNHREDATLMSCNHDFFWRTTSESSLPNEANATLFWQSIPTKDSVQTTEYPWLKQVNPPPSHHSSLADDAQHISSHQTWRISAREISPPQRLGWREANRIQSAANHERHIIRRESRGHSPKKVSNLDLTSMSPMHHSAPTLSVDLTRTVEPPSNVILDTLSPLRYSDSDTDSLNQQQSRTRPNDHLSIRSQSLTDSIDSDLVNSDLVNSDLVNSDLVNSNLVNSNSLNSRSDLNLKNISDHTQEGPSKKSKRSRQRRRQKSNKKVPPIDATWVRRLSTTYLSRFVSSEKQLRRYLLNKIRSAEARSSEDPEEHAQWIDLAIDAQKKVGLINDHALAKGLFDSLTRKGESLPMIRKKLTAKRLPPELITTLISEYTSGDQAEYQQLYGASKLVKKRKIGAYSTKQLDAKERHRQMGIIARKGFSFSIAKKVLNASIEELEEWMTTHL